MIIDIRNLEHIERPNFKGGDKSFNAAMFSDANNTIVHGFLEPGASIGPHRHMENSEIIYVLSGQGLALTESGEEIVRRGEVHYCPKGAQHSLRNEGPDVLEIYTVIPTHESPEKEAHAPQPPHNGEEQPS